MDQIYFLVSRLGRELPGRVYEFPWIQPALNRTVFVEAGNVMGTGSILQRFVIASGAMYQHARYCNSVSITHFPHSRSEMVVSPSMGESQYDEGIQLAMFVPGYLPLMVVPNVADSFYMDETLLMVNAVSGVVPVKVQKIDQDSMEGLSKKLQTMVIDVKSGIPSSFLYNLSGEVAGVAITSTSDGYILVFPAAILADFYIEFAPALYEKIEETR